jgi:dihydroorotase
MKYLRPIDPHVHLRGDEYSFPWIGVALEDAKAVGLSVMLEMPNPTPWLTTAGAIHRRLRSVAFMHDKTDYPILGINIGLTNDISQVEDALALVANRFCSLRADKTFYTHSTGNMGVLDPAYQRRIWELKGKLGYKGVSIGHFEDEKAFVGQFDPANPTSHSTYQCPEAEIIQVEAQIRNAMDADFQGTFYIAHCSNPATIRYIDKLRHVGIATPQFPIVTEVTWHHMFLNVEDDYPVHGNRVKMNPPLRPKKLQEELLELVLQGKVDIIGTDHAPHPIEKKDDKVKPASGVPAIPFWPRGIEMLRKLAIYPVLLDKLIFHNAQRVFDLEHVAAVEFEGKYAPRRWEPYGYNPFARLGFGQEYDDA